MWPTQSGASCPAFMIVPLSVSAGPDPELGASGAAASTIAPVAGNAAPFPLSAAARLPRVLLVTVSVPAAANISAPRLPVIVLLSMVNGAAACCTMPGSRFPLIVEALTATFVGPPTSSWLGPVQMPAAPPEMVVLVMRVDVPSMAMPAPELAGSDPPAASGEGTADDGRVGDVQGALARHNGETVVLKDAVRDFQLPEPIQNALVGMMVDVNTNHMNS